MGIQQEMASVIFERFGQIKAKNYKNQHGTGLGLTISKGLTELLGGEIWYESAIKNKANNFCRGSTFYFTIPCFKDYEINIENKLKPENEVMIKKWSDIKILVVEDDEDNFEFLKRLLQKNGAKVEIAITGEDAVELIKKDKNISIVLIDIRLPHMDRFETTQKIKALNPSIPVIAQTAYALYNDREICLENGCDDYIAKPLNKDVLFKKINHYIYK